MNLLFHLRSDAHSKHGGDVSLGRQYKTLLEGIGHKVELSTSATAFDGVYDAALTFNLDRPFESAQFISNCKDRQIPVLLYCLHHPAAGVASYLRNGTVGFRRLFAIAALYKPPAYESILTFVKVLFRKFRTGKCSDLTYIDTTRAQKFILSNASLVVGSSSLEIREIQREFNFLDLPYAVIPHVLDILGMRQDVGMDLPLGRDIDVLCAGRIESRKNQLQVAKLARLFPEANFVFVGTPSPSEQRYFADFSAQIDGLDNVRYYPSLPIEELRSLFRRSRIFVSLSWFEVVSLTEMEAFAAGCKLLVGKYSYAKDFVSDRATFIDPGDFAAAETELRRLLGSAAFSDVEFDLADELALFRMAPLSVLESFLMAFERLGFRR